MEQHFKSPALLRILLGFANYYSTNYFQISQANMILHNQGSQCDPLWPLLVAKTIFYPLPNKLHCGGAHLL
jgi:hypothetical protein